MTIHFQVQRESLLRPLQALCGISEKRQDHPILGYIYASISQDCLKLTATDLDMRLTAQIPISNLSGEISETTLPTKKLLDVCRALPDFSLLTFKHESNKLIMETGRSRYTLTTLNPTDFPQTSFQQEKAVELGIEACALKERIAKVAFAMAIQDVRFYLNGLLFEISDEKIKVVATDGHRLALSEGVCHALAQSEALKILLPRKLVLEFVRLLEDYRQEDVTLKLTTSVFEAAFGPYRFQAKLMDGRFPDYRSVIWMQGDKVITFERDSIRQSLQRISFLFSEKFRGVRLSFETGKVVISASNQENEEAVEECMVEYEGEAFEIGFNVRYLLDVLQAMDGKTVKMTCRNAATSVLFLNTEDQSTVYVVMPTRL